MVYPSLFIVFSGPSFLFKPKFYFRSWLFSHAAFWPWFSVFFYFFDLNFFRNGFPNFLIVRFRFSFLFGQWKFCELYVRTCPAILFNSSPSTMLTTWLLGIDFLNDFSVYYCFEVKICVLDVISAFRSIAWLTSLKKMTSEINQL